MNNLLNAGYPALEEALQQLREHNCGLEQFVEELLDEMVQLSANLDQQVEQTNQHVAQQAEADSIAVQQSSKLSDQQAEIERFQSMVDAHEERQPELLASRDSITQLKQQLASAKIELLEKDQHLSELESQSTEPHDESELQTQYAALEEELEQVRSRAAELTETVDRQQREISEERVEWSSELKSIRDVVQRRNEPPREAARAVEAETGGGVATLEKPPSQQVGALGGDRVVDSVMAQFAKLQRDISRRRTG
ncbi:MAG: hypothetical protein COA78_12210 [Blastopirellula sp.]|nr:MAG: hypothetical protein COA78_12210 [Blastopirellula sp.]